ncbi:DUF397 domain-containing protein [Streptomyces sp. SID11385]|uniref:DUF397 domain-containing protein n=1 Tax=Streptomyces sp. SID11385 TaxID=2706031 RepID=UPI0013CD3686|nr:DUF397 domain-containing protein [Streptomyces sp. SID11385]
MSQHLSPGSTQFRDWRRSAYSDQTGGNCVEIARRTLLVGVRDSKQSAGAVLVLPSTVFDAFVGSLKNNRDA